MGDRYNIRRDEEEAERYRREVPLRWRIWANVKGIAIITAPIVLGIALAWWLKTR